MLLVLALPLVALLVVLTAIEALLAPPRPAPVPPPQGLPDLDELVAELDRLFSAEERTKVCDMTAIIQ